MRSLIRVNRFLVRDYDYDDGDKFSTPRGG
jgi:hypothetical protein